MSRKYTDEELIAELHRFVEENGRVPEARDMINRNGYPSESTFMLRFGCWNNALKIAGLHLNRYETNTPRTCSVCGINKVEYGTINVKCAVLIDHHKNKCHSMGWKFQKKRNAITPNYYICIGFNEDRSEILKVWIVPGNTNIVAKSGITISQTNLQRVVQYEVDPTPYNEVYQNLDIYTLPEFCNLNAEGVCG